MGNGGGTRAGFAGGLRGDDAFAVGDMAGCEGTRAGDCVVLLLAAWGLPEPKTRPVSLDSEVSWL